jgi:magnesium transporter
MKRAAKNRTKRRKLHHAPPGTAPGNILVREDALSPKIRVMEFDAVSLNEREINGISELNAFLSVSTGKIRWIDVHGFGSHSFIEQLADLFGVHRLQMEDVVNVYQRPKAEELSGQLFLISRSVNETLHGLEDAQVSLFVGENYVLTVQEKYEDQLDPVRNRLRQLTGNFKTHGADYLAYAIMDTVLDHFYPVLEKLGEKLDDLQDELLANPSRSALDHVLSTKKELLLLRRIIWSERDKFNDILRSSFKVIKEESKIYIRDSYDHCIQLLDLVESYREVTASLMDVYHSSVSNRLNQVMKVLTIISTIFIPLTFVVGVYGMNFAPIDPESGATLAYNMPELYSPYGYLSVMLIMLVMVVFQIVFFVKKGWLTKN